MKKHLILLLTVLMIITSAGCSKDNTEIEAYQKFAKNDRVMPLADDLGEYKDYHTLCHHQSSFPFGWDSYTLVAAYYIGTYEKAKAAVADAYAFQQELITDKVGGIVDPVFYSDGYRFQVLELATYCDSEAEFPEEFYLVGFNDERKRIAYIYFSDPDLDTIERGLAQFISEDCGWDRMKSL